MEKSEDMYNVPQPSLCRGRPHGLRRHLHGQCAWPRPSSHQGHRDHDPQWRTGFKISSMRPKAHIFAFTSNRRILSMLNLVWGVRGQYYDKTVSTTPPSPTSAPAPQAEVRAEGRSMVNIASMPIAEQAWPMLKPARSDVTMALLQGGTGTNGRAGVGTV